MSLLRDSMITTIRYSPLVIDKMSCDGESNVYVWNRKHYVELQVPHTAVVGKGYSSNYKYQNKNAHTVTHPSSAIRT